MIYSHFSKPPTRSRCYAGAAKLRQLPRLLEEAPEDGLEDWMTASGDSTSAS
jgi:hypothetical protein